MRALQFLRSTARFNQFVRGFKTSYPAGLLAPIKAGDSIPNVNLYEGAPNNVVNTGDVFGKGTHVIFAIYGAYTGTCKDHFPTFTKNYKQFEDKVDSINCISVNDPFVMQAFGESMGAGKMVRCLADMKGEFTKAVDMEIDARDICGNFRSKRYIMIVKDGKVSKVQVEDDSALVTCTAGPDALKML